MEISYFVLKIVQIYKFKVIIIGSDLCYVLCK